MSLGNMTFINCNLCISCVAKIKSRFMEINDFDFLENNNYFTAMFRF